MNICAYVYVYVVHDYAYYAINLLDKDDYCVWMFMLLAFCVVFRMLPRTETPIEFRVNL